jgi:hypothetical protein
MGRAVTIPVDRGLVSAPVKHRFSQSETLDYFCRTGWKYVILAGGYQSSPLHGFVQSSHRSVTRKNAMHLISVLWARSHCPHALISSESRPHRIVAWNLYLHCLYLLKTWVDTVHPVADSYKTSTTCYLVLIRTNAGCTMRPWL